MARVLVIDDEINLLQMVRLMLERADHTVLTTTKPAQGIEVASRDLPDVVVVDDRMAEMDGADVIRALRLDDRTSHIPIAMIGANYEVESRATEAGADAWLGKPFYPVELIEMVESLAAKRRSRTPST